ncbi:unnamed protein product [marine sediment metagenome]|uniref:Transcription initiation factor IIE subunit alpha N-terminal domain-containing protein n=1 Tax=marine sediment metagenome TaxID=412755 RepID=X0RWH5_9ZZZZ
MKINNKIIDGVIAEVAGEDVIPLVRYLKDKKNISEFKIADAIDKEINETRNMLYRLFNSNLVSFIRKKDKKKGWYIYYWTFNIKRVKDLFWELKKKKIINLKERLKRENSSDFFICDKKCMRLSFEQATDFEYKCPECGDLMHQEDNKKIIEDIKNQIEELEKELSKQN